ncbi:hypothetical protein J2R78_006586 [Bradyrhizobium sp. USDA 4538]|uniref:hypothetical protein n=1 Tax=unclassified Bradyrhizobium TaxID=2631580 RepID=UPI00209EE03F|nr:MULTISPECIES: hypothetical protein [unclassified Bradyrhizobium]MCP1843619.1 hypothetical protein [Bradyrhizobium sp. USDA 4538]MCP1904185.1 hypothetical protein [Bradyrhizobium sp. USDA 4537]MCP1990159.1 hypothetical protein [Bradyrhizobium sp. USDA 4539]
MSSLVKTETGASVNVLFRDDLPPELAKPFATLLAAQEGFNGIVNNNAATLLPTVVDQHNRVAVVNTLRAPFGAAQAALIAYGQVTAKAQIEAMSVPPSNASNQPIRNRAVLAFDNAGLPDKARMLSGFSYQALAGIVEAGCLDNIPGAANPLPDDIVGIGKDRYMLLNHAAKTGIAADHPLRPSAENPAQFGVDEAAVLADAQTGLNNLKARSRHFANGTQVLRDMIAAVSLACSVNTDDAFALLTGN